MENKLIGRFYFRKTNKGNLIGEYSNNFALGIYTESADSFQDTSKSSSENFIGKYTSTWHENNLAIYSILTIEYRKDTIDKIYTLKWDDKRGNTNFWGEAMLFGDVLIGDYRNFENL